MGPVRGTLDNLTDMIEWRSLQSLAKDWVTCKGWESQGLVWWVVCGGGGGEGVPRKHLQKMIQGGKNTFKITLTNSFFEIRPVAW